MPAFHAQLVAASPDALLTAKIAVTSGTWIGLPKGCVAHSLPLLVVAAMMQVMKP